MTSKLLSLAFRVFYRLVSPPNSRAKLSILIYHRVLHRPDPLRPTEITAQRFRRQMEFISRSFCPLKLSEAAPLLRARKLPAAAVCVTFDDGYRDNIDVALPILKKLGIPCTFFIATGYLNGGRMWNDSIIEAVGAMSTGFLDLTANGLGYYFVESAEQKRLTANALIRRLKYRDPKEREQLVARIAEFASTELPDNLMMESNQVRELRDAGMEIGAHTVSHPILATLDVSKARYEIVESRRQLETIIGEPVRLFAYPNGKSRIDYFPIHVAMVREERFDAAVTTDWGVSGYHASTLELRRFTPWDSSLVGFALRLLLNYRQ